MTKQFGPFAVFAALVLTAFVASPSWAEGVSGDVCDPAEDCEVEGDVCCPHQAGPCVPFTCAALPCFRSSGEACCPGDECPNKGDVCCPHAPGPDVPFTCAPPPCFR